MKKKVLFADLDGTLITTISERTFPLGIWDMKFRFNTLDAIKNYGFECLYIVTNQGGIEKGFVDERHFTKGKMNYIQFALEEYLGIPVGYQYCHLNYGNYRKPNTGMLENACRQITKWGIGVSKRDMLMIGDASGLLGQYSDTDDFTREFLPKEYD